MEVTIKRAYQETDRRLLSVFYLYLALGALAIGLYFLVPTHLIQYVYDIMGIAAAFAIVAATRLYKPSNSIAWYLIAIGQFVFVVGDITYAVYQEVLKIDSYPGLSDLFYLGAYPFFAAGVFLIIRRRNPDAHRSTLLDPLLITTGVGMLSWILLIQPYMADGNMDLFARLVSASYPLMDLLLLLAILRLTMGSTRHSPSMYLLSASFLILLISDTIYFLLLNAGAYYAAHPIDAGWLISYLLLGAAAIHPSMRGLSEIVPEDTDRLMQLGRRRLILLMAGALLGPTVLAVQATSNVPLDVPVVMIGSVIMFMIVLLRMTVMMGEQSSAYKRQSESERRFRLMFADSPLPMWSYDAESLRFSEVNQAAIAHYGYSRDEFLSMSIADIRPAEDIGRLLENLAHRDYDLKDSSGWRHTKKHGQIIDVQITSHTFQSAGRQAVLVVAQDITEHKQAEAALRAQEAAEQSNKAKSEFLSRMSHELRTPLNAVLGFGQLLEMEDLDIQQRESVVHILKAGHHLLGLINEVLDISRIEAGKFSNSIEPVPIVEVLNDTLNMVMSMAVERNIRLEFKVHDEHNMLHVAADRQCLKQVILNLLSNALKYNRDGGNVGVSLELLPSDATARHSDPLGIIGINRSLRVLVSDTGHGIPPENLPRLFTAFDRLGAEQSLVEGTGLGLTVSQRLMETMGSTIEVSSTVGQGSIFSFDLPVVESPQELLQQLLSGPLVMPGVPSQAYTLLYIEDNLSNVKLIERVLSRRPGITLITAMQGNIGLRLAQQHNPDLILLDLHLPDIQGSEVLRQLQEDPQTREVPVVMISADATSGQIERLLSAGASAYLTKPLDVKKFLEVVDGCLGRLPAR